MDGYSKEVGDGAFPPASKCPPIRGRAAARPYGYMDFVGARGGSPV